MAEFDLERITPDEKQMAMIAHMGACLGFWLPLILMVTKGKDSPYVKYHATQAIVTSFAFGLVVGITFGICFLGAPLFWGLQVWKGLAANKGTWEGYPGIAGIGRPPELG